MSLLSMDDTADFETKDIDEVAAWLAAKGFSEDVRMAFEGNHRRMA